MSEFITIRRLDSGGTLRRVNLNVNLICEVSLFGENMLTIVMNNNEVFTAYIDGNPTLVKFHQDLTTP